MDIIKIVYRFSPEGQTATDYELNFNPETMLLINDLHSSSEWTQLENNKCSNCPLNSKIHPHCPVARNIESVVTSFAAQKSFFKAKITVITKERNYEKNTDLQEGLYGIYGLIMATSGCPHFEFLKPMARFHLPFSTVAETLARSTSMYLLRQYFNSIENLPADFALVGLEKKYQQITLVNEGIVTRIRQASKGDAGSNALIILDIFASMMTMGISSTMSELRPSVVY